MYTTLEYLEHHIKVKKSKKSPRGFFREIKLLVVIFVMSFVGMLLFTNAQLFFGIKDNNEIVNWNQETISTNNTVSLLLESEQEAKESFEEKQKELDSLILHYENNFNIIEKTPSMTTEQDLQQNMKSYDFDFNLLPPMDRLIVSKINLDVPLIDSKYKNEIDFTQGNFDEELENGVVKYPTTPQPGSEGNTLIFGHTSQEWRQKNPYGTVFSKMPDLNQGDTIKLIRGGNLYEYKIVEKIIVVPSKVDSQFQKYQGIGGDYVTLMGCYPLGRTDKRMMITAKRVG
ncbi:MAG: sortase [Candidatus Absconditabacterales bacterium]|nr:sortase [Candidatus Absconditabacterales bacterium]